VLKSKDYPEVLIAEPLAFQGLPLKLRDILFFGISLVMPNFGITRIYPWLEREPDYPAPAPVCLWSRFDW